MFLLQKSALNFYDEILLLDAVCCSYDVFMIYFAKTLRFDNFSLQLRCFTPIKIAVTVIYRFMFDQLANAINSKNAVSVGIEPLHPKWPQFTTFKWSQNFQKFTTRK